MPIRLAIVDGHTLIRYGLRELLSRHPDIEVAGRVLVGRRGRPAVAVAWPEVIMLDGSLPDGDGVCVTRTLREEHPGLGIVLLDSRGGDAVLFRAAEAGT